MAPVQRDFQLPPPRVNDYPFDLGTYTLSISTTSPDCQTWFNRGLNWSYAFHHEEAERCFRYAVACDSECAMAYWGIAYARGPNYNKAWERFDEADLARSCEVCHEAISESLKYVKEPIEKVLCEALAVRFPQNRTGDYLHWNREYAKAMKAVYERYGDDLDVSALYADAMMALAPWALWNLQTGLPNEASHTLDIERVLEKTLLDERSRKHPGLLHLYIHLMELSPTPERALVPADRLRNLVPDGGHLNHMPGHIDLLIGDYRRAIASNLDAIRGDEKYAALGSKIDFYSFYRLHDYTFPIYAATLNGQFEVAMSVVERMDGSLTEDLLRIESPPMIDWMEGFLNYRTHILVRFGRWDEILARPLPEDQAFYCVVTAVMRYARALAHSVLGNIDEALKERELFREARTRIVPTRFDFPNAWKDTLDVGEAMLSGEIEYRRGNYDQAWELLKLSIHRSDNLIYAEPWSWMQPPRHAYGALLLEQGHYEEAAKIYAEDLGYDDTLPRAVRHPNNVWALKGYHAALVKLGREAEAKIVEPQLRLALAVADIEVESSCFCTGRGKMADRVCC